MGSNFVLKKIMRKKNELTSPHCKETEGLAAYIAMTSAKCRYRQRTIGTPCSVCVRNSDKLQCELKVWPTINNQPGPFNKTFVVPSQVALPHKITRINCMYSCTGE